MNPWAKSFLHSSFISKVFCFMLIHHSKNAMPKIGRFPGLVHCQTNMKNTSENSVQTQSQSPIAEFTRLFCHSCYKSSSGTPATLHPWRCPAINLLFFVTTHLSVSDMVPCAAVASCWHHLPKARVVNPQTKQGNPRTKLHHKTTQTHKNNPKVQTHQCKAFGDLMGCAF